MAVLSSLPGTQELLSGNSIAQAEGERKEIEAGIRYQLEKAWRRQTGRRSLMRGDCGPKKINLPRKEAEELIGAEWAEEVFELEKNALLKDGKMCSTVENC